MNPFDNLLRELDQWNFAGEEATLWWRDDDAARPDQRLSALLALLDGVDVVAGLAVIPSDAGAELADFLTPCSGHAVLQHGVSHLNRAPASRKKQELVAEPHWDWGQQLVSARERLDGLFGDRALPVLVPPWNRIDETLLQTLDSLGYRGVSCFGPRTRPQVGDDLWVINTHVDLVDWRDGQRFVGEAAALDAMVRHLSGRREGALDPAEPTGILSHHLVHKADCLDFIERLLRTLDDHPAVTWLAPERVFQLRWR